MFCGKCGKQIDDDSMFCVHCGARLEPMIPVHKPEPPVQELTPPPMPEPPVQELTPPPKPEPPVRELTPPPMPEPPVQELTPPPMPEPPVQELTPPIPETPVYEVPEQEQDPDSDLTMVLESEPAVPPAPPTQGPRMGIVRAITGVATGEGFRLPETNVLIIGRDSSRAFWIIDDQMISREHCSIRYQSESNLYIVTDLSTNGTFVGAERLKKGVPMPQEAGTVLSLADSNNQILLG